MNNLKKEQEELELEYEDAYLDANLFIFALLDEGFIGESAREIINSIKEGDFLTYTSVLTMDEVLYKIQSIVGREKAVESLNDILSLNNLQFISADLQIMKEAISHYSKDKLAPRDSIHLASMKSKKVKIIISSDSDFDRIKEIKRFDFTKVKYFEDKEKIK